MGHDNLLRTLEKATTNSIDHINEQIRKIDWNKKWQNDYPKTDRAKQELESLKKPDIKEAISDYFDERSLVVARLSEVSQ